MAEFQQLLETVLPDWNYWTQAPPSSVPREVLEKEITLYPDLVCVIQGVRRSGKSTLLAQLMETKKLDPGACYFINFEDPRLADCLTVELLDALMTFAKKRNSDQKRYFFLDEIQNIEGWEKWLRLKVDKPADDYFVITGSNAALLSGELSTVLTGRHLTIELFPFSYNEYTKLRTEGSVKSYLSEGGFPRALQIDKPQALLRQYFTDIIERDVRRHVAARSSLALMQLVKAVFESTGSEVSQRGLAKSLGTSADTVGSYLDACTQAYLILPCPFFSFSERQQLVRNRKIYPIDLGLRNAVITKGGADMGKSLETIVFHQLRRLYTQVFYWRGHGEVDFIVQEGTSLLPFQVSWDGPKDRHYRALEEFSSEHKNVTTGTFISRDNVEEFLNSYD